MRTHSMSHIFRLTPDVARLNIVPGSWTVTEILNMPPQAIIRFELIPLNEVPSHLPVAKRASHPKGSQWDEVLRALEREKGKKAVKIVEHNKTKRNRLKSTLKTMANNRGFAVELRDDGAAIYAWKSRKAGRYALPKQ